ncbi:MAG: hypothetical protein MR346_11330 [Clostridium sp.]|nr:hypothetical protein [Clostridium sp.]
MKKRKIAILLASLMIFTLVGCGESSGSTENKDDNKVTTEETNDNNEDEKDTEEDVEESTNEENRQTILDNELVKIEYVKTDESLYGTCLVIHAENKSDQNLIIQPDDSISLDDTMYSALASQDLMPGKQADFQIDLMSSDNSDVPNDFEQASGTIIVLDEDYNRLYEQTFDIAK